MKTIKNDIAHIGFEAGILIKGINGILEIVGGFLLLYLNPKRMGRLIAVLTQHELSKNPNNLVANALLHFSQSFSISAQTFGAFYLISHGVVKCILVILLWQKKLWAYPLTIASLVLFIVYQIYRCFVHMSVPLILLTVFDIIMIVLTFIEYKRVKEKRPAQ